MIRVVIADDHAVVRQGVTRILEAGGGIRVVGEAACGVSALEAIRSARPDVCLVDLAMPAGGVELVEQARELFPDVAILVFSMHPEAQFAIRCLSVGAAGYLSKGCPPEELVGAVETVAAGKRYIAPAVGELLARQLVDGVEAPGHERLSAREFQVFLRLAAGEGSGEIAATLGLSVKSVSTYRGRILAKLALTRNADLTRYAIEHALLR